MGNQHDSEKKHNSVNEQLFTMTINYKHVYMNCHSQYMQTYLIHSREYTHPGGEIL